MSTLIPYQSDEEAIEIAALGKGSLVASVVTASPTVATRLVLGVAPHHGRVLVLDEKAAKESTGHGSPLAHLIHGGPGRAGGSEEMGVFAVLNIICSVLHSKAHPICSPRLPEHGSKVQSVILIQYIPSKNL